MKTDPCLDEFTGVDFVKRTTNEERTRESYMFVLKAWLRKHNILTGIPSNLIYDKQPRRPSTQYIHKTDHCSCVHHWRRSQCGIRYHFRAETAPVFLSNYTPQQTIEIIVHRLWYTQTLLVIKLPPPSLRSAICIGYRL